MEFPEIKLSMGSVLLPTGRRTQRILQTSIPAIKSLLYHYLSQHEWVKPAKVADCSWFIKSML
ncbi:MAG: hypothetical protein WCF23_02735, partial [Candidatus Nitrosopolaris sp.]